MTNFKFATNKTFKISGMTADTFEPYTAEVGYVLDLIPNTIGGGKHFEVKMRTLATVYNDNAADRRTQKPLKIAALAEANMRCDFMNAA